MDFSKEDEEILAEKRANVCVDVDGSRQMYRNQTMAKEVEKRCAVNYYSGLDDSMPPFAPKARRKMNAGEGGNCCVEPRAKMSKTSVSSSKSAAKEGPRFSVKHSRGGHKSKQQPGGILDGYTVVEQVERSVLPLSCQSVPKRAAYKTCGPPPVWQHGRYAKDDCGSGIVPQKFFLNRSRRRYWCRTPLSMYQHTIGDLGRRILCQEVHIPRDIYPEPPSNIAEYILPFCRGYYRKYDCLRPCEENHVTLKHGKKFYRDRVARYWEPCQSKDVPYWPEKNKFAPHNAALIDKFRKKNVDNKLGIYCW